jgi:hypothetical protein
MMKNAFCGILLLFLLTPFAHGQRKRVPSDNEMEISPTTAEARIRSSEVRQKLAENSLTSQLPLKNIGPTVMSGRVVDIDVDPQDATHFFVAYASGGLWVTHNNGQSFQPVFDHEHVMTIGDFAVDWNNNETIWVGTGEVNSSRSSYSGIGVFIGQKKLNSESESWVWKHSGLPESHHIGRIVLHPSDDGIAWVAALGHLYSSDENRGLYKTMDGGLTWQKVLFVSPISGAVDLVIDPMNPDELYAAFWERTRTAWNFQGNGIGSGIYKTIDGGEKWQLISHTTTAVNAESPSLFNSTKSGMIGRIGLGIHHSTKGKFVYAIIDNQDRRPEDNKDETSSPDLKKSDFIKMSNQEFLSLNDSLMDAFLRSNGFEETLTAASAKSMVKNGDILPVAFYDYLYDANEDLFNTPVVGAEVYLLDEQSGKWNRTHQEFLDDVVFTYGYYFGVIHVSSHDPNKVYIAGVPLLRSNDGGKSFTGINPSNVHADHHAIWENPLRPGHLINGCDGGVQISYDDGKHYVNCNSIPVGQFYAVQVDNDEPYNVLGGLQDNGVWRAPHNAVIDESWKITGRNPYQEINGGDGMQIMVDDRNSNIVYTGYQFGNYMRTDLITGESKFIHVHHKLGERPLRWNWQTPILLSSFNQDIFYICSNKVHRSTDRGESFETLSGDLTRGGMEGNVPYGTITTISESNVRFGLLAAGTDDGLVHISKDNGYTWQNISNGLPSGFWVSRVDHSMHKLGRIYVALNGYRNDCFKSLIYVSEDWGISWKKISDTLPSEPVNVVKEDPADERILYAGTDHGLYISIDRGKGWMQFSADLPAVAVHDLAIQHRDRDLLIGTHGRSLWLGDIGHVGKLPAVIDSCNYLFNIKDVEWSSDWGSNWSKWLEYEKPELNFVFYSKSTAPSCSLEIRFGEDLLIEKIDVRNVVVGLNVVKYDLVLDEEKAANLEAAINGSSERKESPLKIKKADDGQFYLPKATFEVILKQGGCSERMEKMTIK